MRNEGAAGSLWLKLLRKIRPGAVIPETVAWIVGKSGGIGSHALRRTVRPRTAATVANTRNPFRADPAIPRPRSVCDPLAIVRPPPERDARNLHPGSGLAGILYPLMSLNPVTTRPSTIGPYRVEREIARGGMGIVYEARDTRLDRTVAIKAMPDDVAADPDRMARFEREARVLASLN